jgi:arylsulfatase
MYLKWYAKNTMWIFVPIQQKVKEFLATIPGYPFQPGSTLSASNINYNTLKFQKIMKKLESK